MSDPIKELRSLSYEYSTGPRVVDLDDAERIVAELVADAGRIVAELVAERDAALARAKELKELAGPVARAVDHIWSAYTENRDLFVDKELQAAVRALGFELCRNDDGSTIMVPK